MIEDVSLEMTKQITTILGFGFLGLSFLMLFLGYNLIRKVTNSGEEVQENTSKLITYFMKVALIFMILAGPLQWVTMSIKYWMEDKKINLLVGINSTRWEDTFGEIYIRKNGKFIPISKTSIKKEFKEGEEVLINLDEVSKSIESMRSQIQKLNEKTPSYKDETIKTTIQEG
ncbi:MAG: hypothetical protein DSZ08_07375 [Sulfurovum sp.]|nr:MAG: hypothetical protein DSZ08_07375 [Sulfurovum sp.]